jgi:hypothetical protein
MTDRSAPPDPSDRLWLEILAIAARLTPEETDPHLDDPALLELVERAVAPYARALTPEGLAEARKTATFALATHPDIGPVLEHVRAQLARQASGVQPVRSVSRLEAAALRTTAKGGR